MATRTNQKLKLICILDILKKYSDEENPISAVQLCERLASYGVSAERKSVYSDIESLINFGYDIILTRIPRHGYFLASREFELPEVYLLADAVRSADFITPKKTRELISKLDSLLSIGQAKKREKAIYMDISHKCKNEEIYYNIDKISSAIEKRVKIKLQYCQRYLGDDRKIEVQEKQMLLSPYALIWQNDHYYLVANHQKYDNLLHLRLDRMRAVELCDEPVRPVSEVSEYEGVFNIADYVNKAFNMYGGTEAEIEIRCSKDKLEQILDRFSDSVFIYKVTEDSFSFTAKAMVSDGLISWLMQFGKGVEVVSPKFLREKVIERIKALEEVYK